jgi:hypothetical protein
MPSDAAGVGSTPFGVGIGARGAAPSLAPPASERACASSAISHICRAKASRSETRW